MSTDVAGAVGAPDREQAERIQVEMPTRGKIHNCSAKYNATKPKNQPTSPMLASLR